MTNNKVFFCQRCLLPSTYPKITFDLSGFCNVCREIEQKWGYPPKPKGLKALKAYLSTIIPCNNQYQAVVTISGGKDSSYVLYLAVKVLGLKVIAANFDNGFQSEVARRNIQRITELLKTPLITYKIPYPALYNLYRSFWNKTGDFCTPCCIGCCTSGFYAARAAGTNVILHGGIGGSPYSFNVLGFLNHSYERYMKYAKGVDTSFTLRALALNEEEKKPFALVSLPQYLDWREKTVVRVIKTKLGWESDEKIQHADCLVDKASDYYLIKKFGFSKAWMYTSMLLRTKQITLDEARLRLLKEKGASRKELLLFSRKVLQSKKIVYSHPEYSQDSLFDRLEEWLKIK